MSSLTCHIEFVEVPAEGLDGTLRVRLVDVARADAAATVLAQAAEERFHLASAPGRYTVVLDVPDLDARGRYTVEAHLDVDGSGETSVGDFRTMEHFGVTRAELVGAEPLTVWLRRVA